VDRLLGEHGIQEDTADGRIHWACCRNNGARVCNPQQTTPCRIACEFSGGFAGREPLRITNPRSEKRRDGLGNTPHFQARMEARRKEGHEPEAWAVFRRGWRLGAEDFAQRLSERLGRRGPIAHRQRQLRVPPLEATAMSHDHEELTP